MITVDFDSRLPLYVLGHVPFLTGWVVEMESAVLTLSGRPCLVGEFSLALPQNGPAATALSELSTAERGRLMSAFARSQVRSFTRRRRSAGAFYWAWNGPVRPGSPWNRVAAWGLQYAFETGWLNEWLPANATSL